MALINCPECEKQISDKAGTCPGCGVSLQHGDGSGYVTNQQTGKSLKLQSLLAAILLAISLAVMFTSEEPSALAALGVLVGILWYLIVRGLRWWRHG